jgi:hypothetical protein
MKVTIHSLQNKINPLVPEWQKKVFDHFGLHINILHADGMIHGQFIDHILNTVDSDIYIFMDLDCVPLSYDAIIESVQYAANGYLVGNAQVVNCIKAKHDLYCAPSFLTISKDFYNQIGRPSAMNNNERRTDFAGEFSRRAVELEKRMRMWFPTTFQGVPSGGIWRLSGYGYYGVGTIYDNRTYHLFQTRFNRNVELFVDTCKHIIAGKPELINRQYDCKGEYMGVLPIEDEYGH